MLAVSSYASGLCFLMTRVVGFVSIIIFSNIFSCAYNYDDSNDAQGYDDSNDAHGGVPLGETLNYLVLG